MLIWPNNSIILQLRLDDIIVGAPYHGTFGADDAFDIGRVYIYYQTLSVSHVSVLTFESK